MVNQIFRNTGAKRAMQGNQVVKTHRFVAWALALLLGMSPAFGATLTGQVVAVSDGDTVTVLDAERTQHKIRLSGIDAPEKAQAFGERSKQNLWRLVHGKPVDVQWYKRDRFGRIVGRVLVAEAACQSHDCPKTVDAGLDQIDAGLAWWYRDYAKDQSGEDAQRYRLAEEDARRSNVGLWAEPEPVPPWDWRREKKRP